MKRAKDEILAHLAGRDFTLIPEQELDRVWPDAENRLVEIEKFAAENGWRMFSYTKGRGAIFTRQNAKPPNESNFSLTENR